MEESKNNKDKKNKKREDKQEDNISKLKKEREEYLDGWQRERADFSNYKKDTQKYLEDIREGAKKEAIIDMLPIFDNIDLIIKHIPESVIETENNWYRGVEFVYSEFEKYLLGLGLEEIKCEVGDEFNSSLHEVIEGEGSTINGVMVKGYTLNGEVVRHSKVKVENKDNNK